MSAPSEELTLRDLDRRDRGNQLRKIGYHWVIRRDGVVEAGRDESEASIHDCVTDSKRCISVCLVGGLSPGGEPEENFTVEQKASLCRLAGEIYARHTGLSELGWDGIVSKIPSVETVTVTEWVAGL